MSRISLTRCHQGSELKPYARQLTEIKWQQGPHLEPQLFDLLLPPLQELVLRVHGHRELGVALRVLVCAVHLRTWVTCKYTCDLLTSALVRASQQTKTQAKTCRMSARRVGMQFHTASCPHYLQRCGFQLIFCCVPCLAGQLPVLVQPNSSSNLSIQACDGAGRIQ